MSEQTITKLKCPFDEAISEYTKKEDALFLLEAIVESCELQRIRIMNNDVLEDFYGKVRELAMKTISEIDKEIENL